MQESVHHQTFDPATLTVFQLQEQNTHILSKCVCVTPEALFAHSQLFSIGISSREALCQQSHQSMKLTMGFAMSLLIQTLSKLGNKLYLDLLDAIGVSVSLY